MHWTMKRAIAIKSPERSLRKAMIRMVNPKYEKTKPDLDLEDPFKSEAVLVKDLAETDEISVLQLVTDSMITSDGMTNEAGVTVSKIIAPDALLIVAVEADQSRSPCKSN